MNYYSAKGECSAQPVEHHRSKWLIARVANVALDACRASIEAVG